MSSFLIPTLVEILEERATFNFQGENINVGPSVWFDKLEEELIARKYTQT